MLTVRIGADHPHHAQLVTEVDRLERLVTDVLSVGIDVRPGPDPEDG